MAESQQVHGRRAAQDGQGGAGAPNVEPDHDTHGQSTAAWTAVGLCLLAALIMCIAVVIASVWIFVVGAVLAVIGGISGKVLSAMGFGASGRPGH
jgi:Flp pilus assembly protein TadB